MRLVLFDKIIAVLTLISGLSISTVAIYYSVAGLVSIFAASAIPIAIMGIVLELSKLVATIWLKNFWTIAPLLIRSYLLIAIFILMTITSLGIFGYLSKAHLDQAVPTGDVADKIALIDEKIKMYRENIDAARKALAQMDSAVDQTMSRSDSEQAAARSISVRRSQAKERTNLQNEITSAQQAIAVLNDQRAPIAKELRKVEAEVGPIKYIAAMIYGDVLDSTLLEKAVRWVIILIVIIFDPLAIILLLASQYSFSYFKKNNKIENQSEPRRNEIETVKPTTESVENNIQPESTNNTEKTEEFSVNSTKYAYLFKPWVWSKSPKVTSEPVLEDHETDPTETIDSKTAKIKWKQENPNDTIKHQRKLYSLGLINKLPWEKE